MKDGSIFYDDYFKHRIPLTGLFIEHLGKCLRAAGSDLTDELVIALISKCLVETGLLDSPTDEQIASVVKDIESLSNESQEGGGGGSGGDLSGKHFAGYLTDWATKLSYDKLCLYTADYDYAKAKAYFETLDQRSIIAIADEKLRLEFERARVSFEAALFGFGGSYKDTPKEGDAVFDLTVGSDKAEAALKNLGF